MLDEKDGALAASVASAARVPSFSLQLGGAKERVKKIKYSDLFGPSPRLETEPHQYQTRGTAPRPRLP